MQNAKPGEENSERTRLSFTEGARWAPYKYGGATTPAGVHYVHVYHVLHLFSHPKNKLSYLGTSARGGARHVHKCIALHVISERFQLGALFLLQELIEWRENECKVRDESPIYVAKTQEGPELRLRFRLTEAFNCGDVLSRHLQATGLYHMAEVIYGLREIVTLL